MSVLGTGKPRSRDGAFSPLCPPSLPDSKEKHVWSGLYGASRALVIAQSVHVRQGHAVCIVADAQRALALRNEIAFFQPGITVDAFPDWETLPYDRFSPYQDIVSERLATLVGLKQNAAALTVITCNTLMHKLPPKEWVYGESFYLKEGEELDRELFRNRLDRAGYRAVVQVAEHGDFAIRGSLIDVFPMGARLPFRIDLFDSQIDSLRSFDIDSQRSSQRVPEIEILPGKEFPFSPSAIREFRRNWRLEFGDRGLDSTIYRDVSEGLVPAGIEYYLPLFFDGLDTFYSYLPEDTLIFAEEGCEVACEEFSETIDDRYNLLKNDPERPILAPGKVFQDPSEVFRGIDSFAAVEIGGINSTTTQGVKFSSRSPVTVALDASGKDPYIALRNHLDSYEGRVLFVVDSFGRRETVLELFGKEFFRPKSFESWPDFLIASDTYGIVVAELEQGAEIESPPISLLSEAQLFGSRKRRRRAKRVTDKDAVIKNLTELVLGAAVVHESYGVGRYRGLEVLTTGGTTNEFIKLEYADADVLYIPVSALDLISRYSGADPERAPLHKLGSGQWDKVRRKAEAKIRDVAAELLEIEARRASRKGISFTTGTDEYSSFAESFPFEETPDQLQAINSVLQDMGKQTPMDRLVCGDVGFGKTEVAMRAAFVAVQSGYQVAVLVPTTLLARQHTETFRNRFAAWPFRIEQLSRFGRRENIDSTVSGLSTGVVDIVIGTHKILSPNIRFKKLGLLIIDEEHRFGVSQKEKIKKLRNDVDILTLTATPIPRTLNLALGGTRDLSIIATAPERRLAIKTFVQEWSTSLLREAVLREISRGGQVYFVHNKVEGIDGVADTVRKEVPEARVAVAHGQMRERELERVMLDFYHGRSNVLVCTTIIENGIDIPTANTIIVNKAHQFGLAQLYQLRGRIGRSHHRAYAYLLIPHRKEVTGDAMKRLEAVESLEELGVGFTLAMHDLEIRGVGEILGDDQSGHLQDIGFTLYGELLSKTIKSLKAGKSLELDGSTNPRVEIELRIPARLPEDYLPDVHARLILYKRIASVKTANQLRELREEVIDRFGVFDGTVENLFRIAFLKIDSLRLGLKRIDLGSRGGFFEFGPNPRVAPDNVIALVQKDASYRMDGGNRVRVVRDLPDAESRFSELAAVLTAFGE